MQRKSLTSESGPTQRRGLFDRSDPHKWANEIEAWASTIGWHVTVLYILLGVVLLKTVIDVLGWIDYAVTVR